MRAIERKLAILQEIRKQGHVETDELAKMFQVSTMTIRRDLSKLQDEGLVTTEYGGAVLNDGAHYEHNMQMKQLEYQEEKARISRYCAELVKPGDTVFLDSGTTPLELARILARRDDITVMSHSLIVANVFANSDTNFIICPGKYRAKSMAYIGQLTDRFFEQFRFDKLFLCVEGIDLDHGVFVPDVTDGITKTVLVNSSNWVCCIADSSKFARNFHYKICGFESIDMIVCDDGADAAYIATLQAKTQVVTV